MAFALPLVTCLAWGISDYVAGVASRRAHALSIVLASHCVGLVALIGVLLARGEPPGVGAALGPAAAGGALTAAGLAILYRALAIGPMTVVAPISATGATVPVVFGALVLGEAPEWFQWAGIAAAMVGAACAARPAQAAAPCGGAAGPALALTSACAFGAAFVAIDRAGDADPLVTATVVHAAAVLVLIPAVVIARASWSVVRAPRVLALAPRVLALAPLVLARPPRVLAHPSRSPAWGTLLAVVAIGLLGATGQVCLAKATSIGMVASVAVLASLYPLPTVALAQLLEREPVSRLQGTGALLALMGVALLSAT